MPDVILHGSSGLLRYVAEPAVRSLLLGSFAGCALAALRVRGVSTRLLVWRGVLAAALMMPLLAMLVPAMRVPVPVPNWQAHTAADVQQPVVLHSLTVANPTAQTSLSVAAHEAGQLAIHQASQNSRLIRGAAPDLPIRHGRQLPSPVIFAMIYIAGVLFLFARILVGLRWSKRLERASHPVEDFSAIRELGFCARAANLRSTPRLAESEMLSVPLTLGVHNSLILLPADWRQWESGELEAVLAHEVSHVARRDALVQRLALIHRAIFWFSPLAWWLERHLADLAEEASDEAALAGGADRRRYAETLLGFFAVLEGSPSRVWWQGVSMAKAGQAEKRVDRILAWRGAMSDKLKKSLVIGLVAVAAPVVVLTAAVHPSVYNFQEPASAEPPQSAPAPATAPAPRAAANPQVRPGPAPQAPTSPAPFVGVAPVTPTAPAAAVTPVTATAPMAVAPIPAVSAQTVQASTAKDSDDTITVNGGNMTIMGRITGRYDDDWGPRFVIVSKDSNSVTMSGTEEDARHARSLRSKMSGDFIWFERDEKSYVIRDQATVEKAKKFWAPEEELSRKQEELGKQQEALGKRQEALGEKMEQVHVKIPDLSAELQAVAAKMKELSANGGTQEEIGELQSQIGELQSRVGEIQSDAGRQQSEIGRQQGELGRQQGDLGRQQGELGRMQAEVSKQATRQMRELLDQAVSQGLAQPE